VSTHKAHLHPTRPLRVLHLEDSARDAEVVCHKLAAAGLVCDILVAREKESFEVALAAEPFDLIISDYNLPGYDGVSALKHARTAQPDVPVILISGTVGEDEAVRCLHIGATDYLLKARLGRLGAAVQRAIREADAHRTRKQVEAALGESESRKAAILESVLDCILTIDSQGRVIEFNAAAARTFGYTKAEAIGRPLADLIIPLPFRDQYRERLASFVATGDGTLTEITVMRANGSEIPVELSITAIGSAAAANFTCVLRDISARKHADATRARLAAIVDSSDDAIFCTDLDDVILTWNAGAERLYGYTAREVIGQSRALLVTDDNRVELQAMLERAVRGKATEHLETRCMRKDGSFVDVSVAMSPMAEHTGRVTSVSSIARDISGRIQAEAKVKRLNVKIERQRQRESEAAHTASQRMAHAAQHDALTDLPNRTLLHDRITQAIAWARRYGTRVVVLFVDLDRFKQINDSFGHAMGDALLRSVTSRLLTCVRATDTVSRHGGDEFIVVSQLERAEDAAVVADKIIRAVGAPHDIAEHALHVTASVGISIYPDDADQAAGLIGAADAAMYHAKDSGSNNCQFFTPQMNTRRLARAAMEASLREALARQEFVLHYQPKIDLKTLRMTGIEALIRWQHPTRGLVAPGEFVSVAEECGLILPIGRWVLREACRQARAWQNDGLPSVPIAVNVSAVEFRSRTFLEHLSRVLDETGLPAGCLELEVTESVLMSEAQSTTAALYALKDLGVQLAIDDFGTGYSSLGYLSRFPIDTLKIDQSFLRRATPSAPEISIIDAVIGMGRSLKLRVIAEGVETAEQLSLLQRLSCGEGQGYYFSRPVAAEQLAFLLWQERVGERGATDNLV
jgi:diguanylate cyclase (GGDEF)-like protein/PAS domain S-box-containing protein